MDRVDFSFSDFAKFKVAAVLHQFSHIADFRHLTSELALLYQYTSVGATEGHQDQAEWMIGLKQVEGEHSKYRYMDGRTEQSMKQGITR